MQKLHMAIARPFSYDDKVSAYSCSCCFGWQRKDRFAPYLWPLERHLYHQMELRNVCEAEPPEQEPGMPRPAFVNDFVSDLVFTPDGAMLVAAVGDCLQLYDPNRGLLRRTLRNPMNSSISVVTTAGERKIIAASASGCVGIFDIRSFKKPVNIFKAHSQQINSITYAPELEWIVSSDASGQVSYWFLPAVSVEGKPPDTSHYGVLFTCPMLSHMCFSSNYENHSKKLVVCSKPNSSLFLIDNLDLGNLEQDIRNVVLNDSLQMHLAMSPSLAAMNRRNRVQVIGLDEYSPISGANVSSVSHMRFLPTSPVLLLRCTTKKRNMFAIETTEWTSCVSLTKKSREDQRGDVLCLREFGSNILAESLLYTIQEPRFASLKEKKLGVSKCGKVIASPNKQGVRLLSFNPLFHTVEDSLSIKHKLMLSQEMGIFWPTGPDDLNTIKLMQMENFTLCCQFSPVDILLAVGDGQGNVYFHQPVL